MLTFYTSLWITEGFFPHITYLSLQCTHSQHQTHSQYAFIYSLVLSFSPPSLSFDDDPKNYIKKGEAQPANSFHCALHSLQTGKLLVLMQQYEDNQM